MSGHDKACYLACYLACYNSDQNVGKSSPVPWKIALPLVSFWDSKFWKASKDMPLFSCCIPGFLGSKGYGTVPLKSKLPPLVSFLARRVSFLSRRFSFLSRITEAFSMAYITRKKPVTGNDCRSAVRCQIDGTVQHKICIDRLLDSYRTKVISNIERNYK